MTEFKDYECRAFGVCKRSDSQELCSYLSGLTDNRPEQITVHETRLVAPNKKLQLLCSRAQPFPAGDASVWMVKLEGSMTRGKELMALPAAARAVGRIQCYGADSLEFLQQSLGFTEMHGTRKHGQRIQLCHDDFLLQVDVMQLDSISEAGTARPPPDGDYSMVEVSIYPVADGQQLQACRAIGSLAGKLQRFVTLRKLSS
ncbi:hypothetical protein WJX73_002087 [Symbiochloris irregularis]|uniref:Mediator complex subunit 18 n=1 Tax=Symbiochloris irregularis TaxID=706552 RepID=A0AAW1NVT5_9CHLO